MFPLALSRPVGAIVRPFNSKRGVQGDSERQPKKKKKVTYVSGVFMLQKNWTFVYSF